MSWSSRENDDVRGVDGPAARPGPDPVPAAAPSAHQAVTFLELFFDLVWVFAISQLSEHLLEHRTWRGAGETLVMALAMFVIWSFTVYESTMVLARKSEARWIVLAVMAGGLVMNASITGAFEDIPWAFVVPMVLIQVGRSAMTRVHDDYDSLRHHRVSMIVWAAVSAVPWVLGAAGGPGHRLYWWLAAVLIDVVGMWSGHPVPGRRRRDFSEVRFDVEHQVERCRLFLIICLGEGVLTTGRSIARGPQDPARLAAGLLSLAVLIGVWHLFFGAGTDEVDRRLVDVRGELAMGRLATNGQQVLVIGLICFAVSAEIVVDDPHEPLATSTAVLLAGGIMICLVAFWGFLALLTGRRLWPPLAGGAAGVGVVVTVCRAAGAPGILVMAATAVCLAGIGAWYGRDAVRIAPRPAAS